MVGFESFIKYVYDNSIKIPNPENCPKEFLGLVRNWEHYVNLTKHNSKEIVPYAKKE